MHMPGFDGLAVRSHLAVARPHIPVVFLSAAHGEAPRRLARSYGAAGFFHKPFDGELERFIATLRALLNLDAPR